MGTYLALPDYTPLQATLLNMGELISVLAPFTNGGMSITR